jgi:hypothetical protein
MAEQQKYKTSTKRFWAFNDNRAGMLILHKKALDILHDVIVLQFGIMTAELMRR